MNKKQRTKMNKKKKEVRAPVKRSFNEQNPYHMKSTCGSQCKKNKIRSFDETKTNWTTIFLDNQNNKSVEVKLE